MMTEIVDMTSELNLTELLGNIMDGRSVMVTATGRSMLPTFRPGVDRIIMSPFSPDELKVGDVVFFNRGDAVCVHRIIARRDDKLIIRGDGNAHNALERAFVKDVFALVTGGTMKGGHPFVIEDDAWKANTQFVMTHHKSLARVHWAERILRSYPLSMLALSVLMFLSFANFGGVELSTVSYFDKIVHVLMYMGVCTIFWMEWIRAHKNSKPRVKRALLFCCFFPVIMGGLIEVLQEYLVEYRGGDILDFAANTLGCALALAFALAVMQPLIRKYKI